MLGCVACMQSDIKGSRQAGTCHTVLAFIMVSEDR